jgi:lipoprotein
MKKNIRTNIIWILILISCIGLVLYLQSNNRIKENKVQRINQDEEESGKEIIKTKEEVEKQYLEEKEISPYMVFEQNKDKVQAVKYLEKNKLTDLSEFTEGIKKGKIGLIKEIKVKNYKIYKKDGEIYIEYILEKNQDKEYYIGNDVLINNKKDDYISDLDSLVLKRKLDKDLEFKINLRNNELDLSKSSFKIYKPVYKDMESKEILGYIEIKKGE